MTLSGGCACGEVRFEMPEKSLHNTLCYCADCRRQSGAPVIAWSMTRASELQVSGEPRTYNSSQMGRRSFCGVCGTGLFFTNDVLDRMGMIQVRSATLDEPSRQPPAMQVQTADRVAWMESAHELPSFRRFPAG